MTLDAFQSCFVQLKAVDVSSFCVWRHKLHTCTHIFESHCSISTVFCHWWPGNESTFTLYQHSSWICEHVRKMYDYINGVTRLRHVCTRTYTILGYIILVQKLSKLTRKCARYIIMRSSWWVRNPQAWLGGYSVGMQYIVMTMKTLRVCSS